jgi:Mce-associated membrane protein
MTQPPAGKPERITWMRVLAYGVLPGLVLLLAMAAGALKWCDSSSRNADLVRNESIQAAADSAVAVLSYRADNVEQDVAAAEQSLTDGFRDSFTEVAHERVVPDAKARQVSAVASVPGAASVSATQNHAVVLVFVDQTLTVGSAEPIDVRSSYRVTLDKIDGRWLVAKFESV